MDSFLSSVWGARRLPDKEVRSIPGRSLIAGWQFVVETPLSKRCINVCVDDQFPFSLPHFILVDRPEFLTWPHIEEDGLLCLLTGSTVIKFRQPAEVLGELLGDAYRLICESESGTNQGDFRSEFYSYWNRSLPEEKQKIHSLLTLDGRSRLVQIWRGETRSVVGEAQQQVLSWLRHRYGKKSQFDETDYACLLWLNEPLLPTEYPRSVADLYRLACSVTGGKELLERFAVIGKSPFYFILGAESDNGPCLPGVYAQKPVSPDIRGKRRDHARDGFRPGKIPQSLLTQRLFSAEAPATRMRVERVDSAWIHGRGHDPRQTILSSKTVILIGCGSVGGPIAQQLAMAGVGNLILADPEELSWANVGRHPLGAEYVGLNKATSLAEHMQKNYPHSQINGFPSSYEEIAHGEPEVLGKADLIICATADWKVESLLNLQQIHGEIKQPILYVWTEPHACAGHAVLITSDRPCLQCGMSVLGDSREQVTVWPRDSEMQMEPACGAVFQPYGPVELMGTISVAGTLSLDNLIGKVTKPTHRIWAGPQSLLAEAGGDWSKEWINGDSSRARGGFQEERLWESNSLCPACSGDATGADLSFKSANPDNVSLSLPLC